MLLPPPLVVPVLPPPISPEQPTEPIAINVQTNAVARMKVGTLGSAGRSKKSSYLHEFI
jgi:hypothetical protein